MNPKPNNRISHLLAVLVIVSLALAACSSVVPVATTTATASTEAPAQAVTVAATPSTTDETIADSSTVSSEISQFTSEDGIARPAGWDDATHSNEVDPDYAAAFPEGEVRTMKISIDPEQWQVMRDNITEILGELNEEGGMGFPRGSGMPEGFDPENLPEGFEPGQMPGGGQDRGQGGPGFGGGDMVAETPAWVEATIEVDGDVWTHVGIRYKGNSSLRGSWNGDGLKLPFKLDFDEWEDDYPEIDNQRFYGFKQLSLANNFGDEANMRDALAYSVYRAAGLPAGQTTFYNILLDYGEGSVDLGLYTANEVIDDTVVPYFFGSDDGNIYEADGTAASFAEGTRDQISESFEKENNDDEPDWTDIESLYDLIHSDLRTTDVEAWKAELESIFNVDGFLNWLAVSGVIGHWDTYGQMTHNYYLYNDPASGQLQWITWDHNLTLGSGMGGGMRGLDGQGAPPFAGGAAITTTEAISGDVMIQQPGANRPQQGAFPGGGPGGMGGRMGGQSADSTVLLAREEMGENWPLITMLLEIPEYRAKYNDFMAAALVQGFYTENIMSTIDQWAATLAPYANAENGDDTSFAEAIESLETWIITREETVRGYIATIE